MLRFSRSAVSSCAALLTAVPLAGQTPVTIDFAEFRSPTTEVYQATPGGEVYSKGFAFYNVTTSTLFTWGTDRAQDERAINVPGNLGPRAAAMAMEDLGDRMDMYVWTGSPASDANAPRLEFNLFGIQVAQLFSSAYLPTGTELAPISLFFYGFTRNASGGESNTLASSFTIPLPPLVGGVRTPTLTELTFGSAWRQLTRVVWFNATGPVNTQTTGSGVAHQFTNIRAAVVPEPVTLVLLGSGLAVLGVAARRRRA